MTTRGAQFETIVLASSSPRRKQLLTEAGIAFRAVDPPIDEPKDLAGRVRPVWQAEVLAYFKARAVADLHPGDIVLGADTLCALGDEVLGKPDDEAHAREMLHALSHTPHQVITGLAVCGPGGVRLLGSETTTITMRPMSEADIDAYIATGEWIGKAGAYALQETADQYVARIDGSFSNVVGLPIDQTRTMLSRVKHWVAQAAGSDS
jgi:septum formation protein